MKNYFTGELMNSINPAGMKSIAVNHTPDARISQEGINTNRNQFEDSFINGGNISGKKNPDSKKQETEPEKKPDPEDYHLKPPYKVYKDPNSDKWLMDLPGGKITCPGKPKWLETTEKINGLLDKSSNPVDLRKYMDRIKSTADSDYNAATQNFDANRLKNILKKISEPGMLDELTEIFNLLLADETQSTYKIGGAMAGSLCSEMHKYGTILEALKTRKEKL